MTSLAGPAAGLPDEIAEQSPAVDPAVPPPLNRRQSASNTECGTAAAVVRRGTSKSQPYRGISQEEEEEERWIIEPLPAYMPELLDAHDTVAKNWFPPVLARGYFRFVKMRRLYCLFAYLSVFCYFCGAIIFVLTIETLPRSFNAFCGVTTACMFIFFYGFNIPKFHAVLLRKLFQQFDSWFAIFQLLPCLYVFGSYFLCCESSRAAGLLVTPTIDILNTLTIDTEPQNTNTRNKTKSALIGTIFGLAIGLRFGYILYFQPYDGLQRTEFTLLTIPIRPWIMAADCVIVTVILAVQLLLRYFAKLRTTGNGVSRFVSIKWPLRIRKEKRKVGSWKTTVVRANDNVDVPPAATARSPQFADQVADTTFPADGQTLACDEKRKIIPILQKVETASGTSPDQTNPAGEKRKRVRRKYLIRPEAKCLEIPVTEDLFRHLQRRLNLKGGGGNRVSRFCRLLRSETTGGIAAASLLCLASLACQMLSLVVHMETWCLVVLFFFTLICNILLLLSASPSLLWSLIRSFETVFCLFCVCQFFYCSSALLRWDQRTIPLFSLLLSFLSSLLLQDSVIVDPKVRRRWICPYSAVLVVLEVLIGFYLVFLSHDENLAGIQQKSSLGALSSVVNRSPLSLALDALSSIVVYSLRSSVNAYFWPDRMVLLFSDIEYKTIEIQI